MLIKKEICKNIIKTRKADSNKYDYGHVLVVAGSEGMSGAVILSAVSALRAGAGLVTCAIPDVIYPIVAQNIPELMTLPLPSTRNGSISVASFDKVEEFINARKVDSIILGPGLSRDIETQEFIKNIVDKSSVPIVLDADALYAFKGKRKDKKLFEIKGLKRKYPLVLTPHIKEMSRLISVNVEEIEKNKEIYVKGIAKDNSCVCILKGDKTKSSDGKDLLENSTGNAGMATAGSGDVLSGIIGTLVCQNKNNILEAVASSVYIHGLAGDLAKEDFGEISLIASDIIKYLPKAINSI